MGAVNTGNQKITFKYSTPLQADYLNIMLHGLSSPGLMVRPKLEQSQAGSSISVQIHPFSMLIHPDDDELAETDENNKPLTSKMVKISITESYKVSITTATVAIGFKYSFTNGGTLLTQWYGEFVTLDINDVKTFNGIIIATVISHENPDGSIRFHVSTSGADISDFLLKEEGWDCKHWLSLISPRRLSSDKPKFNRFELRSHNNLWSGYINGHIGALFQNNLTIELPKYNNLDNDYGIMEDNFYLIKHNSEGLVVSQHGNEFPIKDTDGGIFAVLDFTNQNTREFIKTFSNMIVNSPCLQENINIYVDDNTLFIR